MWLTLIVSALVLASCFTKGIATESLLSTGAIIAILVVGTDKLKKN